MPIPSPTSRKAAALRILWGVSLLLVVTGSLLPGSSAPLRALARLPVSDKVEHFLAYAWLAFLTRRILPARRRNAVLTGCALIGLGVAIEFAQRLVPGRSFELADMAANALGVLIGQAAAWL